MLVNEIDKVVECCGHLWTLDDEAWACNLFTVPVSLQGRRAL